MNKVAFFDFDNTIYGGYTYEDFINYACENVLYDDKYQKQVQEILATTTEYNELVVKLTKVLGAIVVGWNKQQLLDCTRQSSSRSKILEWVLPVTEFLQAEGFQNVLVTASFEEMVVDCLEVIKMDKLFCSIFEEVDGKYTGNVTMIRNHDEKVRAITQMLAPENTFSIAFGDSVGDAPMLDAVDVAFLVRSQSPEIEEVAKEKGWHLGADPDAIITEIKNGMSIV